MRKRFTWTKRRMALQVVLVAGIAVAACSGDDDSSPSASVDGANRVGAFGVQAAVADMDLLPMVNPFIGTKIGNPDPDNQGTGGAVGNTFPGATLPFGMVQFSPDTGYGEFYGFGGYNYDKGVLQGISLIHSSGTGCSIQQDISFLPIVGNVTTSPGTHLASYQVPYSHANETAQPGYYRVGMNNGVNNELTVTKRAGYGRFTWPATNDATMILNVGRNGVGARSAMLEIVGTNEIRGYVETGGVCGGGGYFVYFHGQFDKPFASFGTYQGETVTAGSRNAPRATQNGGWVKFASGGQVQLRVGVSYVSTDNAKLNMQTEIPQWNFDTLKTTAQSTWNSTLNKVQITGGSNDDRTKFYTALYHSLLHPNLFSDVNGEYIGFDNKTYTTGGTWDKYATFSGWDIYRSQINLVGWLFPKVGGDMAQSMVVDAEKGGGGYPKWPTANDDTCVMVGDAGAVIVANLYAFGGTNFDTAKALEYMDLAGNTPGIRSRNCETRPGLAEQKSHGYIPSNVNIWGTAATNLEFALADAAIAEFAGAIGNNAKRDQYRAKAQAWKTIYSNYTGYIQGRTETGSWVGNFDRTKGDYFVEGNSAQYTWMVPQNYRGLFDHMGGNATAISRLDEHFTKLDAGPNSPYAFMGNEPEHYSPWAYLWAGAPYKSQQVVRRILTDLYRNSADGLNGNDDLGATSAWYVWGALGLYPELPGVGGFVVGAPLFPDVKVQMGNGKLLKIKATNAGANGTYIQSATLGKKALTSTWLPLTKLADGAALKFELGASPNTAWGSQPEDAPPSYENPRATKKSTSFSSDFDSAAAQPDWNDHVDAQANTAGFCCGLNHMESSTRREGVTHSGVGSLMYAGSDNDATRSFSYNRVFDVKVAVSSTTQLSYWIRPSAVNANSAFVAVDLQFSDGTSLRDSGALDQHNVRVHPEFQGRGGFLTLDAWNEVRSNIGQWAAGKTITRISIGYDRPDSTGQYRGFIDDIKITP